MKQPMYEDAALFRDFCRSRAGVFLTILAFLMAAFAFLPCVMALAWNPERGHLIGAALTRPTDSIWSSFGEILKIADPDAGDKPEGFFLWRDLITCLATEKQGGFVFAVTAMLAAALYCGRYATRRAGWMLAAAVHLAIMIDLALPLVTIGESWYQLKHDVALIFPGSMPSEARIYDMILNLDPNTQGFDAANNDLIRLEAALDGRRIGYAHLRLVLFGMAAILGMLGVRALRTRGTPTQEWLLGTVLLWGLGRTVLYYKGLGALVLQPDRFFLWRFQETLAFLDTTHRLPGTPPVSAFWPVALWVLWGVLILTAGALAVTQRFSRLKHLRALSRQTHCPLRPSGDGLTAADYIDGARVFLWVYLITMLAWLAGSWALNARG